MQHDTIYFDLSKPLFFGDNFNLRFSLPAVVEMACTVLSLPNLQLAALKVDLRGYEGNNKGVRAAAEASWPLSLQ